MNTVFAARPAISRSESGRASQSSSSIEIRPLDAPLGAEVSGLDLSREPGDDEFARIRQAHLDYLVLIFRDQRITPAQQIAFSRRFGPLQIHVLKQFALPGYPEIMQISNVVENGKPIGLGDAGHFWHSDLSYLATPSLGSMLHAQELPAEGGDTLFANMYLAWDELPDALRRAVQGRRAEHTYLAKYAELQRRHPWRPDLTQAQLDAVKPVGHPVVRTHPETGRKALFVSEHFTTRIVGLPQDESDALLAELFAHATQPKYQYRHAWRPHDMVFWDNRSTLHLATGTPNHLRRRLYRTTIEGDAPF